jgi:hypothetical protein
MRTYRFLLCLLTIAGMVVLARTLRNPAARWLSASEGREPAPDLAILEKASRDTSATQLLQQAVGRLSEMQTRWLESTVWTRAHLPELSYEGEGRYVRAPGRRFRLELQTRLEGDRAPQTPDLNSCTILSVSDGRDLWTASRIGSAGWKDIQRLQLAGVVRPSQNQAPSSEGHRELPTAPALDGVESLLSSLLAQIDWVRREDRADDVRISGRWKESMLAGLVDTKKPWPEALPRFCRLTLSGERLWPSRLEWWGPRQEGGPDRLLVELEFRDPVFDRPLPPGECLGLFAFDSGNAAVDSAAPQTGVR